MKAGIPVGIEVGGVYSLEECWELVPDLRRDKNTVYVHGKLLLRTRELMALNMKEQVYSEISSTAAAAICMI